MGQLWIAALVVCGLAFLLDVVGMAIPYWLNFGSDLGISVHLGLWQACATLMGKSKCQGFSDFGFGSSESKHVGFSKFILLKPDTSIYLIIPLPMDNIALVYRTYLFFLQYLIYMYCMCAFIAYKQGYIFSELR